MSIPHVNYRKLAFDHYEQLGQIVCAHCGFGIRDVLEVAHLDCDRSNNDVSNLVILCPVWAKRMKDAGVKAADSRRKTAEKLKWKSAGEKAAATRKRNAERSKSQ